MEHLLPFRSGTPTCFERSVLGNTLRDRSFSETRMLKLGQPSLGSRLIGRP
jgi:hypothetical protein